VDLFTYGTLMLPEVMELVIGGRPHREPARLAGYRCGSLRGAVYPGLVPEADAVTPGVLWRDLDAHAVARVDRFEGALYERRTLTVEREDGTPRAACVYVIAAAHRGLVEATAWSEDDFRARHLEGYLRECRAFAREGA